MAYEQFNAGLGGAMSGASTGFSVSGTPVGAVVGGALGLIGGLMQGAEQKKRMGAFDKADRLVQPIDPQQAAFLNRLRGQERFYRAGTDSASAFARQDQRNALAQTQANIMRAGGGINQLLRAQTAANQGLASIGARASSLADANLMAQGNLTNMIAQRRYDFYNRRRDEAMARMEQGTQDINNLFSGALSTLPQIIGAAGAAQEPSFAGNNMKGGALPRMKTRMPQPSALTYQPAY